MTYLHDYKDLSKKEWFKDWKPKIDYNRIQYDNYEYVQKPGTKVVEKQVVTNEDGSNQVMDCVFKSGTQYKSREKSVVSYALCE